MSATGRGISIRITEDAKRKQRTAERRLDEAEDLLENPPMEPDISKVDQQIESLAEKINELKGNLEDDDLKLAIDAYQSESAKISAASPKFSKLFEVVIAKCGDSTALAEVMSKHKELKSSRDLKIKRF